MWLLAVVFAVIAIAAAAAKFSKPARESPLSVAAHIEEFVSGKGSPYAWDDFISIPNADPYLNRVRELCSGTREAYPTLDGKGWCNEEGMAELRNLAHHVREYARTGTPPSEA